MKYFIFLLSILVFVSTFRSLIISGLFNNTTIFLGAIACTIFLYGYFFDTLKKQRWLTIVISAGMFAVIAFSIFLFAYGRRVTATFTEEVAIVLGAGIVNGEARGMLANRLDMAVEYHSQNPNALIIVSGGLGHREELTEAYVMAQYLIARGVNPNIILQEGVAYSTYSNMRYSRAIINEHFSHTPSVVVITSGFHTYRSLQFAQQVGLQATAFPASTPISGAPFAYVREVASVIKMWLIGR